MSSTDPVSSVVSVAVDIGGTFTDITVQDRQGQAWTAKTPSTPGDPSEAFLLGVSQALSKAGIPSHDVRRVLHGTTIATNMILENKAVATALVTTRGFRHVLEIGRQDIPRKANLYTWIKPARPVPPAHVFEVSERLSAEGNVLIELDEESVREAGRACLSAGVRSVAVCLLHAFAQPVHERRVVGILTDMLPGVTITASSDILPVVREYERSLATVINAQVMPGVSSYVRRLEERLTGYGIAAPLLLMKSNGGVASGGSICRSPATTALSGPAAGVVGARAVAMAAGFSDIITVDIGGTSADICLMKDGAIRLTQHGRIGEWPLPLPMVDMVTIGAGGGSLARVTPDGVLAVGPESAGSVPGPAAYRRGGTQATVTDAHVVLGHLPSLLGGGMDIDVQAARKAIADTVANPLGLEPGEAARGILAIANNAMVGAIRVVSVERGYDPRDFVLVPFGGAGPLHGCALAELVGIRTVLIPPSPGVLCAQGLLAADLRAEFSRGLRATGTPDAVMVEQSFTAAETDATTWFTEEGVPDARREMSRVALMRYAGQGVELTVPWPGTMAQAAETFAAEHRALYGFDLPDATVELVSLRVEAVGRLGGAITRSLPPGQGARATGMQTVLFASEPLETPVYDRTMLGAGDTFEGPAIVTQLDATTLVPPGWHAVMDESGSLILRHKIKESR
ncbi:hydantoinase/oxoprolinase family protein [Acetobacter musti]|uniref:Hydantoinase/oxoprolinase family protein n=1 Tax=Acetobacter musti TaxID=864732 RepID=A0ABX0JLP3_9PROT|nr:hydantoinase/oxoprolinase family protein [Acetobacter musti]NHN84152.1 hydantoinase/oxoprolinase family protein [Acetobacter musti]